MSSQKLFAIQNQLQGVAAKLGQTIEAINTERLISNSHFQNAVAICGMIGRGKSSFMNAILANNLLPVDVAPNISALRQYHIQLTNTTPFLIRAHFKNGAVENVEPQAIDKLELEACDTKLEFIEIQAPFSILPQGFRLIETPSIGSVDFDTRTKLILEQVFNVILLVDVNLSLSKREIEFLQSLPRNIRYIIVAANKVDITDTSSQSEQVKRIIDQIKILELDIPLDVFKISLTNTTNSQLRIDWEKLIQKIVHLAQVPITATKQEDGNDKNMIKLQATRLLESAENLLFKLRAKKINVVNRTSNQISVNKIDELRRTQKLIQDVIQDQERDILKTVQDSLEAITFQIENDIRTHRKKAQSIKSDLQSWLEHEQQRMKQRLERHFRSILDDTNHAVGKRHSLNVELEEIRVSAVEEMNVSSQTKSLFTEYRHFSSVGAGTVSAVASWLLLGGRIFISFTVGGAVAVGAWLLADNLLTSSSRDVIPNLADAIIPEFERNVRHNTNRLSRLVASAFTEATNNAQTSSSSFSPEDDLAHDELTKIISQLQEIIK
ncbi:hypothetical protein CAL7716_014960 [Calothrix sp. PCC 7716]|nr:hypothetical protein CAL7716_014960 [Calothrix sp. PCC 7716]